MLDAKVQCQSSWPCSASYCCLAVCGREVTGHWPWGWRSLEKRQLLEACLSHPPALICRLHPVLSLSQLSQLHDAERPTLGHFSSRVCVVLDWTLASHAALKHFDSYYLLSGQVIPKGHGKCFLFSLGVPFTASFVNTGAPWHSPLDPHCPQVSSRSLLRLRQDQGPLCSASVWLAVSGTLSI